MVGVAEALDVDWTGASRSGEHAEVFVGERADERDGDGLSPAAFDVWGEAGGDVEGFVIGHRSPLREGRVG
jgi:hypothetical protein